MKVIVGLGNPGKKYENTRHNVGFQTIDYLATRLSFHLDKTKWNALYGIQTIHDEKLILCKPQTYMNLSGEAVRPLLDYYNIKSEQLLVIYDDLDLPIGKLRLRQKGSAGGHNGIRSIINHLGTEQFNRLRIGIGRSKDGSNPVHHVLGRFRLDEQKIINEAIVQAARACEKWITTSFSVVMNEFNR